MTYAVYINGTWTDTIDEADNYTAEDYYNDYNSNWSGQPEELTNELIELVTQDGTDRRTTYQA